MFFMIIIIAPLMFMIIIVLSVVLLSQPVGHDRKVLACGTLWCGFKSRQHEVVFEVIIFPQNNTIMCKHNII